MWSKLIAKIAGSAAGAFFKSYGTIIVAGLLAAFLGYYVYSADRAKKKVGQLSEQVDQLRLDKESLIETNGKNQTALDLCRTINRANAIEIAKQRENGLIAASRIALLEELTNRDIEDVNNDAETFRVNAIECPAINDDFRRWMRE